MRTLFWILLAAHYGYLEPGYLTDSSALIFVIWMFIIADLFFFSVSSYGKFRNGQEDRARLRYIEGLLLDQDRDRSRRVDRGGKI